MRKQEQTHWPCPLCDAENAISEKTYKICGSCGWGKKQPLPGAFPSKVKTIPWYVALWHTSLDLVKSVALAIAFWLGVIALALMIVFATCSIIL